MGEYGIAKFNQTYEEPKNQSVPANPGIKSRVSSPISLRWKLEVHWRHEDKQAGRTPSTKH